MSVLVFDAMSVSLAGVVLLAAAFVPWLLRMWGRKEDATGPRLNSNPGLDPTKSLDPGPRLAPGPTPAPTATVTVNVSPTSNPSSRSEEIPCPAAVRPQASDGVIIAGNSTKVYHLHPRCQYVVASTSINYMPVPQAMQESRRPCVWCTKQALKKCRDPVAGTAR